MEFFRETHINFLKKKYVALGFSLIVSVICVIYVLTFGLRLGIDFEGGNLVHLKFEELPSLDEVRTLLGRPEVGYADAVLQADPDHNELMIRVRREAAGSEEQEAAGGRADVTAQVDVVNKIIDAIRTPQEREELARGKLNLNMVGRERITDLLLNKDPLALRSSESQLTPEEARERYGKIARQLIDYYREGKEGYERNETKGIIADMEAAYQSLREVIGNAEDYDKVIIVLDENTFIGHFSQLRAEMVSALVGSELGEQALWAVLFSLAGILVYIWFRFNPRFAIAAILATIHDVILTVGIFSMSGREFSLQIVAAVLTIVGYSLNDTIVIMDRIRENLTLRRREAKEDYEGVLNSSINQTLSRTILTSTTTLFVLIALYFLGGIVINDFAFIMFLGIIIGTYSSIFIASPVLSIWEKITGTMGGTLGRVRVVRAG
jgi:preprotein translocase subunit SecF